MVLPGKSRLRLTIIPHFHRDLRSFAIITTTIQTVERKPPDGIEPSSPLYKSGASPLNALRALINIPGKGDLKALTLGPPF